MRRVLAGTDVPVVLPLLDADGEVGIPAVAPAVTVVDAAGDAVAGSPFASTLDGDGAATFTLPNAVTDTLDVFRATASGDTAGASTLVGRQTLMTVERFLYSIAAYRNEVDKHSDATRYPAPALVALRTAVEERMEKVARRAWTRRARRLVARVDSRGRVALPDIDIATVRSVSIDGTAVPVADVEISDVDWGWLQLSSGARWTAGDDAVVVYEYGLEDPPGPIVDAAIMLASASEVSSAIPQRATAMTSEMGTWRITIPGRDGPTGIPDVDVALSDWGRGDPAIG